MVLLTTTGNQKRTLKQNAPETVSDYVDEVEAAVKAAKPEIGSDIGLAPSDQTALPPSRGRGRGRGGGQQGGQGRGRARGRGLRPVSKSMKMIDATVWT